MGASRWQWGLMLLIIGAAMGALFFAPASQPRFGRGLSPEEEGELYGKAVVTFAFLAGGVALLVHYFRHRPVDDDEDEYRRE